MTRIGRSELNYGDHRSVSETLARIDEVSNEEVREVARTLLARPMSAAVVGPYRSASRLPASVRSAVAG